MIKNSNHRFVTVPRPERYSGSSQGEVESSYANLRARFGAPPKDNGDGYKVSTSWYIRDNNTGTVFEVYDYKETNTYYKHLPSVRSFRSRPSYAWHIGGNKVTDEMLEAFARFVNDPL